MNRFSFAKNQFASSVANYIAKQFNNRLEDKESINVAISGGTSPLPVYAKLKGLSIDWKRISFYLVDERAVPLSNSQNNYHNINKSFFQYISSKSYCIHDGTVGAAISAEKYEKTLLKNLPKANSYVQFDFILLGMGLDGHIASLFPENRSLSEKTKTVVHTYVDQLDSERISLTLPILNNAFKRILLIDSKKEILFNSDLWKTLPIGLLDHENMDTLINELDEN